MPNGAQKKLPRDGEMVKRSDRMNVVRNLLTSDTVKKQFDLALPKLLTSDRFLRIAMTEIQRTPELLSCDQHSLLGALMECAQLGLEPGLLGQAWIIPYKRTATLIVGYKGLLNLARRSGEVSSISAHVVFKKDTFDFQLGDSPFIKHRPTAENDPGEVIAAYAVAMLKGGAKHMEVMWKRQIDKIRNQSPAGRSGPWVTHEEEMIRKTLIRRLCKFLPLSVEVMRAVDLDERADVGIPQDVPFVELPADSHQEVQDVDPLDQAATELESEQEHAPVAS